MKFLFVSSLEATYLWRIGHNILSYGATWITTYR